MASFTPVPCAFRPSRSRHRRRAVAKALEAQLQQAGQSQPVSANADLLRQLHAEYQAQVQAKAPCFEPVQLEQQRSEHSEQPSAPKPKPRCRPSRAQRAQARAMRLQMEDLVAMTAARDAASASAPSTKAAVDPQ